MINVKKSDFEVFQALESDASASIGSAGSISECLCFDFDFDFKLKLSICNRNIIVICATMYM